MGWVWQGWRRRPGVVRLTMAAMALAGATAAHAQDAPTGIAPASPPLAVASPAILPAPVELPAVPGDSAVETRAQAVQCLALAIAYEAGFESAEGQAAVAEVILNRMRSGSFQKTVCGVVYAGSTRRTGCQFTFTCDGSLRRALPASVLAASRAVAERVFDGLAATTVAGATHYHATYVRPYWAPSLVRLTRIGNHIFYRMPGGNAGRRAPGVVAPPLAIAPGVSAVPAPAPGVFAPWGLGGLAPPR